MTTIVDLRAQDDQAVLFICDFSPPRGSDPELLEPAGQLDADVISIAYNPGRSVRVSSPLAAHWVRQAAGKEVLFTLATRDMNKVAVESLLLGADLLGLDNVMAVRGDEFTERDLAATSAVYDFRPTEMIAAVAKMNEGLDYKGMKLRSPTSFCIGASIDLGHEVESEARLLHKKVEAGAQFFLLQTLFDPSALEQFLAAYTGRYGGAPAAPIFCGVQVLTADGLVFSDVPLWATRDLEKGRSGEDIACQVVADFVERGFRSIYLVPPVLRGGRRDYDAAQRVLETFKT